MMITSHFIVLWQYWHIWHLWPHFPSFRFPFQELQEQWLSRTKPSPTLLPVFHVDVCMLRSCSLHLLLNTVSLILGKSKICSVKVLEVARERCKTQVLCIGWGGGSAFSEMWLFGLTRDIYTGVITCALIFVEVATERHRSMNAPDTSVGLDKVWHYILTMCMTENELKISLTPCKIISSCTWPVGTLYQGNWFNWDIFQENESVSW